MPALLVTTLFWPFALVLALSTMTLNLSRWIRRARLRAACEVAAFVALGFEGIAAWSDGEPGVEAVAFARLALFVASVAWLVAVLSTPAWTLRTSSHKRARAHTERATWRDLPDLMYVVRHSFSRPPLSALEMAWLVVRGQVRIVCDECDEIVGLLATFPLTADVDWIELLAVMPRARRQGVASRLIASLRSAWLFVREGNAGAQAFYTRAGFVVEERWPRYYGDGKAALVMRRAW